MSTATVARFVVCLTLLTTPPVEGQPGGPHMWATALDDSVDVGATAAVDSSGGTAVPSTSSSTHLQRMRAPVCPRGTGHTGAPLPCPGDPVEPLPECGDAVTLPPLWESAVPDAVVTPWRLVGPAVCARPADITPAMVLAAFRRLPLAPPPLQQARFLVQRRNGDDLGTVAGRQDRRLVHAGQRAQALQCRRKVAVGERQPLARIQRRVVVGQSERDQSHTDVDFPASTALRTSRMPSDVVQGRPAGLPAAQMNVIFY